MKPRPPAAPRQWAAPPVELWLLRDLRTGLHVRPHVEAQTAETSALLSFPDRGSADRAAEFYRRFCSRTVRPERFGGAA